MHATIDPDSREIELLGLRFTQVRLIFESGSKPNRFGDLLKTNTLEYTISQSKYRSLAEVIWERYPESIRLPLGEFLLERKLAGDPMYKRFLNRYGDETYSRFSIQDPYWKQRKGLYCFTVGETIVYIGKCIDSFGKRINTGYGNISPKNCYLDGQATNCHINNLITRQKKDVKLFLSELSEDEKIDSYEKNLIRTYQPAWNIALK